MRDPSSAGSETSPSSFRSSSSHFYAVGNGIQSPQSHSGSSLSLQQFGPRSRRSFDLEFPQADSSRSQIVSPPPSFGSSVSSLAHTRNPSLRSKLSLPNLRGRGTVKDRRDDASSIASASQTSPDNETVQVKDTDFELIRPNIPQLSSSSSDDNSNIAGPGSVDEHVEFTGGRIRAQSPALSMTSAGGTSRFSADSARQKFTKTSDVESMDAHRQRELKWVSLMSSLPASQSRSNKKFKKLLLEGVPSSVRFLVWAHLTDSKAKGVSGVYSQLVRRGKPTMEMERGVQACLDDEPRMQSTRGSLLCVLQAYLMMVPDTRHHRGEIKASSTH